MKVSPLACDVFRPKDDLLNYVLKGLERNQTPLQEKQVLAITSKIVSLAEGASASARTNKEKLIRDEADYYLGELGYGCHLTIKHQLLMISAGIDESNSENGEYILLPKDPFASAQKIYFELRQYFDLRDFGVLITDSRTSPLRQGVLGCGLACFGFRPIENKIGASDLFGRQLKMTQLNKIDALAVSAVMVMGEADEQTPLAIIDQAPVEFTQDVKSSDLEIEMSQDLYYPMYRDLIQKKEKP